MFVNKSNYVGNTAGGRNETTEHFCNFFTKETLFILFITNTHGQYCCHSPNLPQERGVTLF